MADRIISFIPKNDEVFRRGLKRLAATTDDFRIPFGLIGRHWYKGNKKIFALKSAGLYPDFGGFEPNKTTTLKGRTVSRRVAAKFRKLKKYGFVFPLLKASGATEKSLTSKSGSGAVFFAGRQSLIMGTSIPYVKFHQSDRKPRLQLPQRKVIFISGGPAEKAKDSLVSGRLEAWLNIINDHISQLLTGKV